MEYGVYMECGVYVRASVDTLCRDGTSETSRDLRIKREYII